MSWELLNRLRDEACPHCQGDFSNYCDGPCARCIIGVAAKAWRTGYTEGLSRGKITHETHPAKNPFVWIEGEQ